MKKQNNVVIIGSGLSGLVSGYILAKYGYKVTILEQHSQIGGCLQSFQRFGEHFNTGMHYLGGVEKGQVLYKMFRYLNLTDKIKLSKLDPNGFDVFSIAGKTYKYASGTENFIHSLAEAFPAHATDLRRYLLGMKNVLDSSAICNFLPKKEILADYEPYYSESVNDFLARMTNNSVLQSVLAGHALLYAGIENITPMFVHAMVTYPTIQSAYRIVSTTDLIAKELANAIRAFGGEILTNVKVAEIICDDKQAVAVRTEKGQLFTATHIIAAIHPQLVLPMVESTLLRPAYRARVANLNNTISCFTIYLKFKANSVPYNNYNYYYYRTTNTWETTTATTALQPVDKFLYMHHCNEDNQQYARTAELISYMSYEEVRQWQELPRGRRGADYAAFKQQIAEKYLRCLEDNFPGINACIEQYETSTPLTYADYTGTIAGSLYGIVRDKNHPLQTMIPHCTKIPNLFLTGQNTYMHGFLGVSISALIACSELVDRQVIMNDINQD